MIVEVERDEVEVARFGRRRVFEVAHGVHDVLHRRRFHALDFPRGL